MSRDKITKTGRERLVREITRCPDVSRNTLFPPFPSSPDPPSTVRVGPNVPAPRRHVKPIGCSTTLSPATKSWVDNCLVPILVNEYLTESKKPLATQSSRVAESAGTTLPREVNK